MARKTLSLKHVAYHEAGHAVAAFAMQRRVRSVTVIPEAGSLGHNVYGKGLTIQPDAELDGRTRSELERRIICGLAGWAVEVKLNPRRKRAFIADTDWHDAYDCASYVAGSGEETAAYVNWLWIRTKQLVALPHYWAAIEALAAELVAHRRIGERRVREVIKSAMRKHAALPERLFAPTVDRVEGGPR